MNYYYALLIVSAAVFALFTVFSQKRLNKHTDMQVSFLIAAKAYNFNPLKSMVKRTAKYFLLSAALLFILTGAVTAVYGIINAELPDLVMAAYVFGLSLAAYALNGAMILFCAMVYVKHKIKYTPVF